MTTMTTARPPLLLVQPPPASVAVAAAAAGPAAGAAVTSTAASNHAFPLGGNHPALAARAASATTVPVFVPGYGSDQWSLLRGSILGSSTNPTETTVTIFCNDQSQADSCELADALPFVFAEGPSTLHYTGESPGTLTVNLACQLDGTTAATCTGYSSCVSGLHPGHSSDSFETSWTSTFSGSAVQWGVLTLSVPPSTTGDGLQVTASDAPGTAATPPGGVSGATTATASGDVDTSGMLYSTASATSAGSPSLSIPFSNVFSRSERRTGQAVLPSVSVSVSWALVFVACLATAL